MRPRRVAEGDLSVRAKVEGSAEQRTLATTFNGMTARLERLVAGQRDFVADASHQLRTPLSGLMLRLEEARAASDDPEVHEEIDAGMAELDRLAAIITELLVLSQAGEVDAPPEALDLDDAARRAAARWDGTDGASVQAVEAAPGAPAYCPQADLDRVLDALIENALRYGGGDITVVARPGGVEVLDRGPGLPVDELEAVFERFHRGRAGRAPARRGPASGLAIARELARRWGGDVELANRRRAARSPASPSRRRRASAFRSLNRRRATVAVMTRSAILWTLAAIAGVVLVAGVTYAASGLSSQTIGLSSEPLGAGGDLAPAATPTAAGTSAADRAAARRRAAAAALPGRAQSAAGRAPGRAPSRPRPPPRRRSRPPCRRSTTTPGPATRAAAGAAAAAATTRAAATTSCGIRSTVFARLTSMAAGWGGVTDDVPLRPRGEASTRRR